MMMARFDGTLAGCVWHGIGYDGGPYTGDPWRVVLHTTEGSTADAAFSIFRAKPYASHFVVDDHAIYQLIDTSLAARALQHVGTPETNRLSCVQIEMVGFAGHPKNRAMLSNTRRLLRALEAEHGIPRLWPNGHCIPGVGGADPGNHNRNAFVWATRGGYYGHEHVPENVHWDPALNDEETNYLMTDQEQPDDHAH
jgi:hypothetical protein